MESAEMQIHGKVIFERNQILRIFMTCVAWYLYKMVVQNMLIKCQSKLTKISVKMTFVYVIQS